MNVLSFVPKNSHRFYIIQIFNVDTWIMYDILNSVLLKYGEMIANIILKGKYTADYIDDVDIIGDENEEMLLKVWVKEIDDYIKIYFDMQGNYKDYEIGPQ